MMSGISVLTCFLVARTDTTLLDLSSAIIYDNIYVRYEIEYNVCYDI